MKKQKGFGLTEVIIVMTIVAIIIAMAIPAFVHESWIASVNEITPIKQHEYKNPKEYRHAECVYGYVLIVPEGKQMLDKTGNGIPCNE